MKPLNRCLQIFRLKALYGQLKKTACNLWLRLRHPIFLFANYSLSLLRLPLGNTPCSAGSIHRTQRNLPLTQSQKPHLHALKKSARHSKLAPCLVYPCRDYLREVVSAPLKFWALVPPYMWDRYVHTSKIESAVPVFLARVNGVREND